MAVQSLSYLDLTLEQRGRAANVARQRIRDMMMSPLLTPEQIETLTEELEKLDRWEQGKCT